MSNAVPAASCPGITSFAKAETVYPIIHAPSCSAKHEIIPLYRAVKVVSMLDFNLHGPSDSSEYRVSVRKLASDFLVVVDHSRGWQNEGWMT
jgi:hypothetical protein